MASTYEYKVVEVKRFLGPGRVEGVPVAFQRAEGQAR